MRTSSFNFTSLTPFEVRHTTGLVETLDRWCVCSMLASSVSELEQLMMPTQAEPAAPHPPSLRDIYTLHAHLDSIPSSRRT